MQKKFATVALALLTHAHSNASDDLVYYDDQVHATTWVVPTESDTNAIIKRHDLTQPALKPLVATVELFRREEFWFGTIEVGTSDSDPQQDVDVMFDTGSPYLWVTSSNTPKSGLYDSSLSSTWTPSNSPFTACYGAGSCEGHAGSDMVDVGGIQVRMSFGSVTGRSEGVQGVDGIMGLSLSPGSPDHVEYHFFHAALTQYHPHFDPIAAFCFGTKVQEVHLGQVKEAYLGKIEYHKVIELRNSLVSFWIIGNGEISAGKTTIRGIRTIMDTGSGTIVGPPEDVAKIYEQIPRSRPYLSTREDRRTIYVLPCNHQVRLSFRWDSGNWWIILPEDLVIKNPRDSDLCYGAIEGQELPYSKKLWLVGNCFMRGKYIIHDAKKEVVGVAEAKEKCAHQ